MAKRRSFNPFGLAFLDVMSCGFGAAVLVFMLVKHNIAHTAVADNSGMAGVTQTFSEEELQADIERLETRAAAAAQASERVRGEIADTLKALALVNSREQQSDDGELDALRKELENKQAALLKEKEKGRQRRAIKGEGKRKYLVGLRVEGRRILILFDRSASMIDDELVNIIRGKFLPASERRKGGKWRWGTSILRWILAHLPESSDYQVFAFNDKVETLLPTAKWTAVGDEKAMDAALARLAEIAPEKGTDLQSAFRRAARMSPPPSAIYVVTDSLPTLQPAGSRSALRKLKDGVSSIAGRSQPGLVTAEQRLVLFQQAVAEVPGGVPVHTILLPTKGDPNAAAAFWGLSAGTKGRFLAPSWDWPQ